MTLEIKLPLERIAMVEKLWNIVKKSGLQQTDSGRNKMLGPVISIQNAPCTTEETRTYSGDYSGLQVQESSALKRKIVGSGTSDPRDKMTRVQQKYVVLRMQENEAELRDNWRRGYVVDLKRRAPERTASLASTNVSVMGCAVPVNITKCLLSPATSLSSVNKATKESHGFHPKSETPKTCALGLLVKRGLVKQQLHYNQQAQMPVDNGGKENAAGYRPCRASNIEPQAMTMPLFRVPLNRAFLTDIQQIKEGSYNNDNLKCHSEAREDLMQAVEKQAAAVSVEVKNAAFRCTTPRTATNRITNSFTPPTGGRVNKTPRASPLVACFNGGGVTPPLCHCGRRTRRRSVINPGPNQGRAFFACSLNHGRSSLTLSADRKKSKSGCKFFRWEVCL